MARDRVPFRNEKVNKTYRGLFKVAAASVGGKLGFVRNYVVRVAATNDHNFDST